MFSAISFGVFCRSSPSTKAIMRSMNVSPGLEVIFTTIRSDSTVVPPVTADRSPPDSRKQYAAAAAGRRLIVLLPVLGADGRPVRIAEPLWDRATHDALVMATAPRRDGTRAPKGMRLLTGRRSAGTAGRGCMSPDAAIPGTRMSAPRGSAGSAPRHSAGPPRP